MELIGLVGLVITTVAAFVAIMAYVLDKALPFVRRRLQREVKAASVTGGGMRSPLRLNEGGTPFVGSLEYREYLNHLRRPEDLPSHNW